MMGKFTIKQLLDLNTGKSKLPLKNLFFVSEEIIDFSGLMAEGMVSEGFYFEIRGVGVGSEKGCVDFKQQRVTRDGDGVPGDARGIDLCKLQKKDSLARVDSKNLRKRAVIASEGDWGCLDAKQQRVSVKLSHGSDGGFAGDDQDVSWWLMRERTSEPCKLLKRDSVSTVDSELLTKRPEEENVLGRREGNLEVEKKSTVNSEDSNGKALRAEMIKARFADTIRKAQEQKLLSERNKTVIAFEGERGCLDAKQQRVVKRSHGSDGVVVGDDQDLGWRLKRKRTSEPCQLQKRDSVSERAEKERLSGRRETNLEFGKKRAVNSQDSNAKTLQAERIKVRFADTSRRAQEQKFLSQGNKAETESLERRKGSTEAEIRAVDCQLMEQRQKEREAARIALEKMERTVEWNHALDVMQEFEKLIGVQYHVERTAFARDCFQW